MSAQVQTERVAGCPAARTVRRRVDPSARDRVHGREDSWTMRGSGVPDTRSKALLHWRPTAQARRRAASPRRRHALPIICSCASTSALSLAADVRRHWLSCSATRPREPSERRTLRKQLPDIYTYRSADLHGGAPFPLEMCMPRYVSPNHRAPEVSVALNGRERCHYKYLNISFVDHCRSGAARPRIGTAPSWQNWLARKTFSNVSMRKSA
jgi:hypothetical protein